MSLTINDLFPSRFLKGSDRQRRVVTIKSTAKEELGKSKEQKAVVYFNETKKGLVSNVTNARKIAAVTGSIAIDQWPGKKVALVPAEVEFQGDIITAIRMGDPVEKSVTPNGGSDAFLSDSDDDVPAFSDTDREPGSDDGDELDAFVNNS